MFVNSRRIATMLYTKPELVPLASAVEAIQGVNKDCNVVSDSQLMELTIGAY
jgi:hypothetical protein